MMIEPQTQVMANWLKSRSKLITGFDRLKDGTYRIHTRSDLWGDTESDPIKVQFTGETECMVINKMKEFERILKHEVFSAALEQVGFKKVA